VTSRERAEALPIFRGIVCTDCGAQIDAARLRIRWEGTYESYHCPECGSDQIDWALWDCDAR
jgi:predicted RNA-binding Zn-ribbon protein involved in translation (DUF1610 family)